MAFLDCGCVSSLVFTIYADTLDYPFIFDDTDNIVTSKSTQLNRLTLEGLERILTESYLLSRPVSNISFALNYYFHQYRVFGYHLVNILIHLLNGLLLYLFIKQTLSLPSLRSQPSASTSRWLAMATAIIWLVHPIQTETVTYIVQRMNGLAALFSLLSFVCYIKGRLEQNKKTKWIFWAGSLVSFLLALGSKEMVAVLPFLIFLYEWCFFSGLKPWLVKT